MGGRTGASRNAHMRDLIAEYLPRASRNDTLPPLVVASGAAAAIARLPRARPDIEAESEILLGYAAAEPSHDLVAAALAEAAAAEEQAQGDVAGAENFWREHLVQANRYLLEFPGSERPLDLLD